MGNSTGIVGLRPLHIYNAFGAPSAVGALVHAKVKVGGGLDFNGWMVLLRINRLAVENGLEGAF